MPFRTDVPDEEYSKIECTICHENVKRGMKLYHCTRCVDTGFNVYANCYSPSIHDIHAKHLKSGIYPEFNPLGKIRKKLTNLLNGYFLQVSNPPRFVCIFYSTKR